MHTSTIIRRFKPEDAAALFEVFYSAVHLVACRDYSPEQIQAWAPKEVDRTLWQQHLLNLKPFVIELHDEIVGYADLQTNGYIDHFFVSGQHAQQGIGTQLMVHILAEAKALGLTELTSDVSRTAQPFYAKYGFVIVEQRYPELRGVIIPNTLMKLSLQPAKMNNEPATHLGEI